MNCVCNKDSSAIVYNEQWSWTTLQKWGWMIKVCAITHKLQGCRCKFSWKLCCWFEVSLSRGQKYLFVYSYVHSGQEFTRVWYVLLLSYSIACKSCKQASSLLTHLRSTWQWKWYCCDTIAVACLQTIWGTLIIEDVAQMHAQGSWYLLFNAES